MSYETYRLINARCVACGHEWLALVPTNWDEDCGIECMKCKLMWGEEIKNDRT